MFRHLALATLAAAGVALSGASAEACHGWYGGYGYPVYTSYYGGYGYGVPTYASYGSYYGGYPSYGYGGLGYGYFRAGNPEDYVPFIALGNVVSLMHFWYDGFVWSVRKGDV